MMTAATQFVDTLELGAAPHPAAAQLIASEAIDGSALIAFGAQLAQTGKSDIANSLLLAHLVASKAHRWNSEASQWYAELTNVLSKIGWARPRQIGFSEFAPAAASYSATEAVAHTMSSAITPSDLATVQAVIAKYTGLGPQHVAAVGFECASHSGGDGAFQTVFASGDDDGTPAMALGMCYFGTKATVSSLFSTQFPTSTTTFVTGCDVYALNEDVFGQVRENVANKVAGFAPRMIIEL